MVISVAVAGVISNCSMVPTSFSLIIVAAETTEPLLTNRIPMVPVTMNHELTSPGLKRRAMRVTMFPWPTFCSVMPIATGTPVSCGDWPLGFAEREGDRVRWPGDCPIEKGDGASWSNDPPIAEDDGATLSGDPPMAEDEGATAGLIATGAGEDAAILSLSD